MNFIACLVPVLLNGHPDIIAMTGTLIKKTENQFIADFSHAAQAVEGIEGDYSRVTLGKEDCSNIEDKHSGFKDNK